MLVGLAAVQRIIRKLRYPPCPADVNTALGEASHHYRMMDYVAQQYFESVRKARPRTTVLTPSGEAKPSETSIGASISMMLPMTINPCVDSPTRCATSSSTAGRCRSDRAMTAQRQRLPNRRPAHTETLDVGGQTFTA